MTEDTSNENNSRGATYLHESQEIPCLRMVITNIDGVVELESKDYYFQNVVNGMNYLLKKHQELSKPKDEAKEKDISIG